MIKKIILIIVISIFYISNVFSKDGIFIDVLVDNKIITNIDINKEEAYLKILNPKLSEINKNQIYNIAKNSLINELIKEKELQKMFDLKKEIQIVDRIFSEQYKQLNFNNDKEFSDILLDNNSYSSQEIKNKLKIQILWNDLIVSKYENQIKIDKTKFLEKINRNKNKLKREYFLSEIFINRSKGENLNTQIEKIKSSIVKVGFNNTANIFSVSETAKFGGKIGWIGEDNLSKDLLLKIEQVNKGQYTDVIEIGNNLIILKIEDIRTKKIEFNEKDQLKKMISFERNRQLNQFSNIYFNKIKINTFINEK